MTQSTKFLFLCLWITGWLFSCSAPRSEANRSGGRRCSGNAETCAQLDETLRGSPKSSVTEFRPDVTVHALLDSLQILGNTDEHAAIQEALGKLFRQRSPALRKIFLDELVRDSTVQGLMWISFGVQPEGRIGPVKATGSTLGNPIFDARIARKIESWQNIGIPLKSPVIVMLPLEFKTNR